MLIFMITSGMCPGFYIVFFVKMALSECVSCLSSDCKTNDIVALSDHNFCKHI